MARMIAPITKTLFHSAGFRRCCLLCVLLMFGGCRFHIGGESSVEAENQRLRDENHAYAEQVGAMQLACDEALAKVRDIDHRSDFEAMRGMVEATPRLTRLEVETSSVLDAKGIVHVYVVPHDGRDRFLQIVGELKVTVTDGTGTTLGERSLTPVEVRDAYRSGLFGTHYLVEFPIGVPGKAARVSAVFTEAPLRTVFEADAELRTLAR